METNLIYIYNMVQAQWMIKQLNGKHIYKIGLGSKGDILITFIKNTDTLVALKQWVNSNPNK